MTKYAWGTGLEAGVGHVSDCRVVAVVVRALATPGAGLATRNSVALPATAAWWWPGWCVPMDAIISFTSPHGFLCCPDRHLGRIFTF